VTLVLRKGLVVAEPVRRISLSPLTLLSILVSSDLGLIGADLVDLGDGVEEAMDGELGETGGLGVTNPTVGVSRGALSDSGAGLPVFTLRALTLACLGVATLGLALAT